MKNLLITIGLVTSVLFVATAQVKNSTTETVKVLGNCDMCKTAIENAGFNKGVSEVTWDKDSKNAVITYNKMKTTGDAVLKKIALAGYDSDRFLAPDDTYAKLSECCRYERVNKQMVKMTDEDNHADHKSHEMKDGKMQVNPFGTVTEKYFTLKDALVSTDAVKAAGTAKNIVAAIDAVDMGSLSEKDHMTWMKVMSSLKTSASGIAEQKDIEKQRSLFIGLSEQIYSLVKSTIPAGTIYYQHCPMANNGKGANWLSKESAIKNPYYGSMMLTCGKVTDTIK